MPALNAYPVSGLLLLLVLIIPAAVGQSWRFKDDCSDPHYKEITCVATKVDCSSTNDELLPQKGATFPSQAHDIRIESFSKVATRGRIGEQYRLVTDISWQTPPNNSSALLTGFLLEIEGERGLTHECFLLNMTGSNWTSETIHESPRIHFSMDSFLNFAAEYEVSVYSLPEAPNSANSATKQFVTPQDPSHANEKHTNTSSPASGCMKTSNPFASQWTAGFKHILLHSIARVIEVHFVGAPPQYCFEQYEVRLLDESGMELLHSGIVTSDEMRREIVGNRTVYYGQYNFMNLELDISYIPSVIPNERARDGRCLCPTHGTNPYDNSVICSCVAAHWKPIRLTRTDVLQQREDNSLSINITTPLLTKKEETTPAWLLYALLNAGIVVVLVIIGLVILYLHREYHRSAKIENIRLVRTAPKRENENGGMGGYTALFENGHLLTASNKAILPESVLNVLIVYAHDSQLHEEAVLALAELLRDEFNMEVALDVWNRQAIEANRIDYLSASVVNADMVMVVNSIGAYQQYRYKIDPPNFSSTESEQPAAGEWEWVVERKENGSLLDDLFLPQLDMALQHDDVISVRFPYTPSGELLPMLQGQLQYVVPDNLVPLLSRLYATNMKADRRVQHLANLPQVVAMKQKVEGMVELQRMTPNWFSNTHHRRLVRSGGKGRTRGEVPTLIKKTAEGGKRRQRGPTVVIVAEDSQESGIVEEKMNHEITLAERVTPPPSDSDVGESEEAMVAAVANAVESLLPEEQPTDSGIFHMTCTMEETAGTISTGQQFPSPIPHQSSIEQGITAGAGNAEMQRPTPQQLCNGVVGKMPLHEGTGVLCGKLNNEDNNDSGLIADVDFESAPVT